MTTASAGGSGFLNRVKRSGWKVLCGCMLLLCTGLLISYFIQGSRLSEYALANGQRVLIPLKKDGDWVGQQIKLETKQKANTSPEFVFTESPDTPDMADGQIATTHGKQDHINENYPEMVVNESLEKMHEAGREREPMPVEDFSTSAPVTATADKKSETSLKASYARPLSVAPGQGMSEQIGEYMLPRISHDGKIPWQHYGKEFDDNGKPLVAIIIHGLGLGRLTTESALNLDSRVTLSFSPYAKNTGMWGNHARNIGHEIMLDLPQESKDYPAVDPGPYALLNTLDTDTNRERLHWVMSQVPGYVGFLQNDNPANQSIDMINAFTELANRGIFLIESRNQKTDGLIKKQGQMGLITHPYSRRIDEVLSPKDIRKQLDLLIKDAKRDGTAIAVARPYPLTLKLLNTWLETLEDKGVVLAPASAVMKREY